MVRGTPPRQNFVAFNESSFEFLSFFVSSFFANRFRFACCERETQIMIKSVKSFKLQKKKKKLARTTPVFLYKTNGMKLID